LALIDAKVGGRLELFYMSLVSRMNSHIGMRVSAINKLSDDCRGYWLLLWLL